MDPEKMLVGRHKKVAFMDADGKGTTYTRMTGFTSLSEGKNSIEYSRQYVDEASERSDVVGYSPAIDYELDRYTNDPVHEKIATITDDERLLKANWRIPMCSTERQRSILRYQSNKTMDEK